MKKAYRLLPVLLLAAAPALAAGGVVTVKFVNNSGFPDDQVHLYVIGHGPGGMGYYDWATQTYVAPRVSPVTLMTTTLQALESGGEISFSLPQILSGRIFFSYGADFDVLSFDCVNGEPGCTPRDRLLYDKVEFDTHTGDYLNMNTSNVDFWSLPITFQAVNKNTGTLTTYGFQTGIPGIREAIFAEFAAVSDMGTQECANSVIFRDNLVQRDPDGTVWRVVAPDKVSVPAPALPDPESGDWKGNFQYFSYFWNDYVKDCCWVPNRTINLHYDGKDFVGTVDSAGELLSWDPAVDPYFEFPRPAWENKPAAWPTGTGIEDNFGHVVFGATREFAYGKLAPVVNGAIQRGTMHLPGSEWFEQSNFYQGTDSPQSPVNHYGRILHKYAIGGQCYAISYDDGGGYDTAIYVNPGETFTITLLPFGGPRSPWIHDYNGDGTSDIAVFRPASGLWAVRGTTRAYFGGSGDVPAPGDYNGNGTTEIGIFRPGAGLWALRGVTRAYFGSSADTPLPGDYDGDGTCDQGLFRASAGLWAVRGVTHCYFGSSADAPVPGYYAGDGSQSPGVFRGSSGLWAVRGRTRFYFGGGADRPVPGDYTGAGPWAAAVFRADSGLWAVRGVTRAYFGGSSDQPVPADFRGEGVDAPGIFRAGSGLWSVRGFTRAYFGGAGDIPVTR